MTEEEWQTGGDGERMERFASRLGIATTRKRRLVRVGGVTIFPGLPRADLVREIFGNPFSPVGRDPTWLTAAVLGMAQRMYDTMDFSPMPILADALQEAGCDNADVLAHCRGPGPHVRGCWVVDLVLGKN